METLKIERDQNIVVVNSDRSFLYKPNHYYTFYYFSYDSVCMILEWANFQGFCDEEKITPSLLGTFIDSVKKEYREDSCAIDDALDKVRAGKLYLKDILN